MKNLYVDCEDIHDLIKNLGIVPRRIAPTTHARVVLMPTQKIIKVLKDEGKSVEEIRDTIHDYANDYWKFFVDNDYTVDASPRARMRTVLGLYESFHLLEALPQKWGKECLYKCNCVYYFKHASCWNVLLLSMVMDMTIKVPSQWIAQTVQSRRKRGRPGTKNSIVGDDLEPEARESTKLSS